MLIPINLASQPFRRKRAIAAASIAASVALAATLAGQIWLVMMDRARLADARREVNQLNRQIREARVKQAELEAVLRKPGNEEVLERSVFINKLLYRKSISWTRIFADLERTIPYNVRIISIRPSVNGQSQVTLDMNVGAESPEPIIDLLKALESSPLFGSLYQHSISPPSQSEPLYRCHVSVNYAQKL
jgi:Tfp pilus assembly protein PilN